MNRRWRLWRCFQGKNREADAQEEIRYLKSKGFKAKIWATRPTHKTSGHTHCCVLCTFDELLKLAGIGRRKVYEDNKVIIFKNC